MYRLLIVTKDARVEEMFASMEGWEAMGYKPPRLRSTVDDAKECMRMHHIDAIAIDNDPAFAPLNVYMDEQYPLMPVFAIADTEQSQWAIMREVYQLLNQLHADDSDDEYDEGYRLKMVQERWMKKLLSGMAPTRDYILTHHRMLRCPEKIDAPFLRIRLSIPQGDNFITERWHYGSDRLEVALRNFFGEEHDHMKLHVAVISPEEVRVMVSANPHKPDKSEVSPERALGYIRETIEQIQNYLGLSMTLMDTKTLTSLTALATEECRSEPNQ